MTESSNSNVVKTWDLSGMGGGYENACQKMLWTGIKEISKLDQPDTVLDKMQSFSNVYGLVFTPESFKPIEEAMMKAVDNDCTGAMYQCVTGHLRFISKNGLKKWHEELKKGRKDEQELEFDLNKMELVI